MQRVLFGGTFDPPHLGHLVVAEAAFRRLGADVVTFLPAGRPWQKDESEPNPAEVRLDLVRAAIDGVDYFEVDDREVRRQGPSFTADTIAEFPDDDIWLVLGADAAAGIPTWERADEVMAGARFAVAGRPGSDRAAVEAVLDDVVWLDLPLLEVSGSEIRDRVRRGASIRFLVPDEVRSMVDRLGLYAPPPV